MHDVKFELFCTRAATGYGTECGGEGNSRHQGTNNRENERTPTPSTKALAEMMLNQGHYARAQVSKHNHCRYGDQGQSMQARTQYECEVDANNAESSYLLKGDGFNVPHVVTLVMHR
eukprot:1551605-Amphidinium_carterae.2